MTLGSLNCATDQEKAFDNIQPLSISVDYPTHLHIATKGSGLKLRYLSQFPVTKNMYNSCESKAMCCHFQIVVDAQSSTPSSDSSSILATLHWPTNSYMSPAIRLSSSACNHACETSQPSLKSPRQFLVTDVKHCGKLHAAPPPSSLLPPPSMPPYLCDSHAESVVEEPAGVSRVAMPQQ